MKNKLLQEYYSDKAQLKASKEYYRDKSLETRRKLHLNFFSKNKKFFYIMDALFVLGLLFNVGAMILTNMLVVKNNPSIQFTEGNPIQAKAHDWKYDSSTINKYIGAMINIIMFALFIAGYFFYRRFVFSEYWFISLFMAVIMLTVGLGLDFFHDLGLFFGKMIW